MLVETLWNICIILAAAGGFSVLSRFAVRLLAGHRKTREVAVGFLASFATVAIWVIAGYSILNQFAFFQKIMRALMTGSGIAVVVLAFISQEAIGNVIDGLILIFSNAFEVGDVIIVKELNLRGTVKAITLNHTEVLSFENATLIIPNKTMKNAVIENLRTNDVMCNFLNMKVAYDTNLDRMEKVVREEILAHRYYIDKRTEAERQAGKDDIGFQVTEWGGSSITVRVSVWTKAENGFYLLCDLRRSLLRRFAENGIEIPYPHVQLVAPPEREPKAGAAEKTAPSAEKTACPGEISKAEKTAFPAGKAAGKKDEKVD